jgi:regulatory protein
LATRRNRTGNKISDGRRPIKQRRSTRPNADSNEAEFNEVDQQSKKVMKAALNILATRSCSEGQLRERLSAKGWAEARLIEDCIKRLKKLGYVNDERFAQGYANYRIVVKPLDRARLARELAVRKLSRSSIEGALNTVFSEVPEETLIDRAIARRMRTHGRPADRAAAKRLFDHLARLGFEYDLIVRKLTGLKTNVDNE